MEMGAFQAKGEIIYFIKPRSIPPTDFDQRIIKYVQEKYAMGCFDYDANKSDTIFVKLHKRICGWFFKDIFQANSFFVMSRLYYQSGGLKKHSSYLKLKREILFNGNKSYL
jgi:hypothetical protein